MRKPRKTLASILALGILAITSPTFAEAQSKQDKGPEHDISEDYSFPLKCMTEIYDRDKGIRVIYRCKDGNGFGIRVSTSEAMYDLLTCRAIDTTSPTRTNQCSLDSKVGGTETFCSVDYLSKGQEPPTSLFVQCRNADGRPITREKMGEITSYVHALINYVIDFF